jgi:predicted GH43/DUF377 family glycosyl hydrolase
MINTFTVPETGNYRCTARPFDGHSAIALLAIGQDGTPVTIAEWAGTNPFCTPRGGTVDVFGIKDGTIVKIDRRGAQLVVDRRP